MILMLDNNIVIDFLALREPFFETSRKVILLGASGESMNYITVPMLTDIYFLLKKDYGPTQAQDLIEQNLSSLNLVGVSTEDALWCLQQRWQDFEDSLVARAAENVKANYIVTRDKNGFRHSLVPAITPDELFELLRVRGITYTDLEL